jgi:hypothetical protein
LQGTKQRSQSLSRVDAAILPFQTTRVVKLYLQSKSTEKSHGETAHVANGSGGSSGNGGDLRLLRSRGLDNVGGAGQRNGSGLDGSLSGRSVGRGLLSGSSLGGLGLLSRGGGLSGSSGGGLLTAGGGRVLAELLSSGKDLVDGNVGTALLQDTSSGVTLNGIKVLADAGKVGGLAVGVVGDGLVKARKSTLGDIREGLGTRNGGEGNGSESVLHFD